MLVRIQINAADVQPGDIVSTGETVVSSWIQPLGNEIERRKVFIRLDKNGKSRIADWNKTTKIKVQRLEK